MSSLVLPKIYDTPKSNKEAAPLRPIVSSIGSLTYNAAKVLADILGPLVGKTSHHIMDSGDFVKKTSNVEVNPGQKLISYDVSALFTSIPVPDAIIAVKEKLENDDTPLSIFCLNINYFVYKGHYYKQTHGAAIGPPVFPIVAKPLHGKI